MRPHLLSLLAAGVSIALSALPSPAFAEDDEADHYSAISNTAMSITGDIWMDDTGITFENDAYLEFSDRVADSLDVDGKRIPASVYRIAEPADPKLNNGNRLCGSGKVTYLASWVSGSGLTAVAVFTGKSAPKSDNQMCASFTYEAAQ